VQQINASAFKQRCLALLCCGRLPSWHNAKRITLDFDSAEWTQVIARVRIWPLDLAVARAIAKLDFENDPADEIIGNQHRSPHPTANARPHPGIAVDSPGKVNLPPQARYI